MPAARYRGIALASAVLCGAALSPFEAVAEPLRLDVVSASAGFDQRSGQAVVTIRLTDDSRARFADFTRINLGQPIDVRVDGKSMLKPVVREPITGGTLQISMDRQEDAGPLAARFNNRTATVEVEAVPR
jgi:preprotein translocase subunit SecD